MPPEMNGEPNLASQTEPMEAMEPPEEVELPKQAKPKVVSLDEAIEVPDKDGGTEAYNPGEKERELNEHIFMRIDAMKKARKDNLPNLDRSIEDIWRDADREYVPHELQFTGDRKRLESEDDTGWRSRRVNLEDPNGWQSNQASPDLYVKVSTAVSILVDMNPEATFIPSSKKYKANTELAYGNWKNSWEVSGAKQQMKNFIFNLSKYGTAYARTYPKQIKMKKSIRTEYYPGSPEKDKYEKKTITKYDDLCRESLNPWQVWHSELATPGDPHSIDDWYFEKDFSKAKFDQLFGEYANAKCVAPGSMVQDEQEEKPKEKPEDTITVGFYEDQVRDLYAIVVPSVKVILYYSPLPNNDGMLSLWMAQWTPRDDRSVYGIGLYEIIRQDSIMFDKLFNMTMDQLALSIYKMFFYKPSNPLGENGQLVVSPGRGYESADPNAIKFVDTPGPGDDSWQGLKYIQDRKDIMSGVSQQLTGKFGADTLGQDLQAKEAALERMKTPLDYILDALQQEAFLTLSWQKQILSTPEILEYTDVTVLKAALEEFGLDEQQIQAYMAVEANPNPSQELLFADEKGKKYANVYRENSYSFEKNQDGELKSSKDTSFYRFGVDLPTKSLDWKGIVRIEPKSILVPSRELEKKMKLDLFNLVYPAIQTMTQQPTYIPMLILPIKQIIKAYDEDTEDWVDEKALMGLHEAAMQPKETPPPETKASISVNFQDLPPEAQVQVLNKYMGIKIVPPLLVPKGAQLTPYGTIAGAAPQGQEGGGQAPGGEQGGDLPNVTPGRDGSAAQIKPVARINEAPSTMQGAVAANNNLF
jgi:hypothetical protein